MMTKTYVNVRHLMVTWCCSAFLKLASGCCIIRVFFFLKGKWDDLHAGISGSGFSITNNHAAVPVITSLFLSGVLCDYYHHNVTRHDKHKFFDVLLSHDQRSGVQLCVCVCARTHKKVKEEKQNSDLYRDTMRRHKGE